MSSSLVGRGWFGERRRSGEVRGLSVSECWRVIKVGGADSVRTSGWCIKFYRRTLVYSNHWLSTFKRRLF